MNYTGSGNAITASGSDAVNCHLEGFKLVGTSAATGGILISKAGTGCRRGIFRNIYVTDFTGVGVYGVDLAASLNNGIYYNLFERVDSVGNRNGFRVYSSDGATNGFRCNSNTFVSCDASANTGGVGVKIDYANGNTFIGLNTEGNNGYGINCDNTYEITFCGGYSENNVSGAANFTANAARIHYYGRRTVDSINGTTNSLSSFFTTDNFTVDANGNIYGVSISVSNPIAIQNTNAKLYAGSGTPEGSVTASVGSLYLNTAGGALTTLYVKTSGVGNTGWVAK